MTRSALHTLTVVALALLLACLPRPAWACEGAVAVCGEGAAGSLGLIVDGRALPVVVGADADAAVRDAAQRFAKDLGRVGGTAPIVAETVPAGARAAVIVGVAGQGGMVDALAAAGKIDLAPVAGRWEAFGQFVVDAPLPGVDRALVIAGSDRRGAAYGLYDLSEKIGVSPWHWWADVPVERRATLYLTAGGRTDAPAVRYRGFFINDEDPAFGGWARARFGGVNARVYEHVFELLLRLKGNYLWPAMWGKSIAEDDPASLTLAARMGVVLGTSHHEPLTRAHVEWERALAAGTASGAWNYETNAEQLRRFWRAGMERAEAAPGLDYVATVGMRGDGDEAMSDDTAIPLLERIVTDQRAIVADVTGRPAAETPQVWALYKEVQDYYDQGMRVPDDVTLLFADDNWGQIRRLPDPAAPPRAGGYGVYYHFDYVGAPRNYKWTDTNQVAKVWQQMNLAWERGARALWVVNVGDIKPMEYPLDFFLDMAWDPAGMTPEAVAAHSAQWASAQFGAQHGQAIGDVLLDYGSMASLRKPELLDAATFPPEEYRALAAQWDDLVSRAAQARAKLPPAYHDAFYQLVEHRVLSLANLYRMYAAAAWNAREARRDAARAEANAAEVERAFARDAALTRRYHEIAGGKWAGMMNQVHIGYTSWNDPPADVMPAVSRGDAGAAVPFEDPAAPEPTLLIPAAAFARAEGGGRFEWTRVPHLGHWGGAPLALPQGRPATSPEDGVYLEYPLRLREAGDYEIEIRLVPTLDTVGADGQRLGLQVDDGPVEVVTVRLEPTGGGPDTPLMQAWYDAVIANGVELTRPLGTLARGAHRLRLYRIDDNVVPQALLVRRAD
ncbi:MAG TPA: glycosyl hydrolase 115 family protein [Croceibacterium sp.]|nr:glycosyl hydrolase 115 family protein [Croceibacterium sp.]